MLTKKPDCLREGQTISNFLTYLVKNKEMDVEILRVHKNEVVYSNSRLADVFHIDDKTLNRYYDDFLEECS